MKAVKAMFFPEEFINTVREESDIVDVISNYVSLKKSGSHYKGLCPFHSEKTPSFMVNPSKQIFHCFGCGEGGNVFHFLMKHEHMGFPDSVRALAERCGRPVPEIERTPEDLAQKKTKDQIFEINEAAASFFSEAGKKTSTAQSYLNDRGVTDETISVFRIGYAPDSWDALTLHLKGLGFNEKEIELAGLALKKKSGDGCYDRFRNRIMFPIVDIYGRVLGFGGRVLDDSTPKYLNSPETPVFDKGASLYGLNLSYEAIRKQEYAILVEGYMDVITTFQNGIRNIAATLGTALTRAHVRKLQRYTRNLALFFDSDEAGIKAAKRSFDICVPEGMKIKVVTLAQGEDPDSFLGKYGKKGFSDRMAEAKPIMDFMIEHAIQEMPQQTLDEKVAIAERLIPLLAMIPNPIEQELYTNQVASLVGIDPRTMKATIRSNAAKPWGREDPLSRQGTAPVVKGTPVWEGAMVGLMINHPDLVQQVKERIEPGYFSSPGLRSVVQRIFDYPGGKPGTDAIRSLIPDDDDSLAGVLSGFFIKDHEPIDLHGLIDRVRQEYLKRTKKTLQQEAETAEKQGRDQDATQLAREIYNISLEVETLQQKLGSERRNVRE
ncbi:MAG: DNA primase [bacterium]